MNDACVIDTPLGPMHAVIADGSLRSLDFCDDRPTAAAQGNSIAQQIAEYFARRRQTFDISLAPRGSDFQQRVWQELLRIPYGTTTSYGALARRLGTGVSPRAVGRANATNPIAIIVPCHRVIGADGSLTGYAGGIARKAALLALERGEPAAVCSTPFRTSVTDAG